MSSIKHVQSFAKWICIKSKGLPQFKVLVFQINNHDSKVIKYPAEHFQTGEFDWPRDLEGVILSAFSYRYLVAMPFSGYFANRFGAKLTLLLGLTGSSILTILSPVASSGSPYLLVTLENIKGILIVRKFQLHYSKNTGHPSGYKVLLQNFSPN